VPHVRRTCPTSEGRAPRPKDCPTSEGLPHVRRTAPRPKGRALPSVVTD
jgi:hypothetical protein